MAETEYRRIERRKVVIEVEFRARGGAHRHTRNDDEDARVERAIERILRKRGER